MRLFPLLLLATACKPTSLLELNLFVGSDALDAAPQVPHALYVDFGPGQLARAISLCTWEPGEFRQTSLSPIEFPPCPETRTITGVLAPIPEGNSCNEGAELLLGPPEDETTWTESGSIEVFATGDCSIIETHTLVVPDDAEIPAE